MNKYPIWKYVIIALAVVVSVTYAVPNIFGEVPVVQVHGQRATVKVDDALKKNLEDALKAASLAVVADRKRHERLTSHRLPIEQPDNKSAEPFSRSTPVASSVW